jgi:hypothetical protein
MSLSILQKYYAFVITLTVGLVFSGTQTFGQVSDIQDSFSKYSSYNLQEKVYLHTDRSFYLCGEVLWFKAYVTNASNNQPLSLSKVAYIEVLNKMHQPVLQQKIAMQNGCGNGSFLLPFSITSGNYELRAYTNWMKNFSADNYFNKNITIVNTTKNIDTAAIHEPANYTAGFFPEGGNLVNGLISEIAFKVNDNRNKGINSEGVIIDEQNDTIVPIKTFHSGIGHFYLQPEKGKNYTAIINFENGSSIRETLPKAYDAGYVMHVADTGANNIKISIASRQDNIQEEIYIIIQNNGRINFARSLPVKNGSAFLIINKDSLGDGMAQVTLFDANKRPQCERLYFKRPQNKMLINAKADKDKYHLRSKVLIDVATIGGQGSSLAGNLSASVTRLDDLHKPDEENIFSYLWLSSNLRGAIEDPAYYFSDNAETNEALDNLVLAQGWRKFDWSLLHAKPSFTYVPEYSGHIITGRITDDNTKKPVPDVLVYLSVPGRRVQLKGCISDNAGLVHFDMKDFFGSNQVVVQTTEGTGKHYHVEIFSPFSEKFIDDVPAFDISENDRDYLQAMDFHMEVENGYHEKDLQKLKAPLIDTLPFYNKATKTYLLDNYTRFTTMEEVMREYVNEIDVRRRGEDFRFMSLNMPATELSDLQTVESMFKNNPLVLLDGVPVFDINKIIAYDPLKVQKLEVVASKYYWGPIAADGIVSYTTYKGNLEGYTLDPGDLVLDYDGLQQQRIFYSPDYSTTEKLQSRLPDFRDVLYWSPDVNTNEKGQGFFSFYTGDIPGKYFVNIQGNSSTGEAGNIGFILNVEK